MLLTVKGDARLRLAGLLAAGSLAVHQIRYAAGYGSESSQALADQGHDYLGPAGAVVALLVLGSPARPAMGWIVATVAPPSVLPIITLTTCSLDHVPQNAIG